MKGSDIATMNASGTGLRILTPGYGPDWSPNGTKIAYMKRLSSADTDIVVMNPDGSNPVTLAANPAAEWDPAWSPDGTRIAFTSGRVAGQTAVFVMDANGTNVQQITDTPGLYAGTPSWSPDGARIAFSASGVILVVNADGSNVQEIRPGISAIEPQWSPDGKLILFRSFDDDLYTISPSGGNTLKQITATPGVGEGGAWSPNGKQIVFSRWVTAGGDVEIYTMNLNGTGLKRLTNDNINDWSPDWTK